MSSWRLGVLVVGVSALLGCGSKTRLHGPPPRPTDAGALDASRFDASFDAGRDADVLRDSGSDAPVTFDAGRDAQVLRDAGRDAQTSFDAGRDAQISRDAGRDAQVLRDAGRDAQVLRDAGLDAQVLRDAGLDAQVLRDAGSDAFVPADAAVSVIGCADGRREGYLDLARYPDIAACAGGWDRPGIAIAEPPQCARRGGDDGPNPTGMGCGVSDLCEAGWHVCIGPDEVADRSIDGCEGAHDAVGSFFASRTSGTGCGICATGTSLDCGGDDCRTDCAMTLATGNDVFGCGTVGAIPDPATCGVFDAFSSNLCVALPAPWSCIDDGAGTQEAYRVTKAGPRAGGVLCCRD